MRTHLGPSVTLSAIIIRACDACGSKREFGKICESCGNEGPARVTDLGVIASKQRSRWERLKWNLYGYHAAQRRIKRTNREMLRSCGQ